MKKKGGLIALGIVVLIVVLLFVAYNLFRFPARFRSLSNESLKAEQVNELKDEMKTKDDKKVLVAYFSYSGTTKGVAEVLSGQIGADLFEISPKEEYSSLYLQSNAEIRKGARPELSSTVENIEEYDIIFIGYPVWFHATPAPINSFLESYDLTGKTIIPFATSGGSGMGNTNAKLKPSCPGAALLQGRLLNGNLSEDSLKNWVKDLNLEK